jgi:hypothetical protein
MASRLILIFEKERNSMFQEYSLPYLSHSSTFENDAIPEGSQGIHNIDVD